MQELIIKNVNTSEYESVNLNQHYDPNGEHKRAFEKVIIHITNISDEKKCFI